MGVHVKIRTEGEKIIFHIASYIYWFCYIVLIFILVILSTQHHLHYWTIFWSIKKKNCHSTLNFFLLFNLHMAASMFMGMIIDLIIIWEERVDCFKMIDCRKHCLFFYTDIITVLFAIYISITPLGMLRIMFCYSYSKWTER